MTAPTIDRQVEIDVDPDAEPVPTCDARPNWHNTDECGKVATWYATMRCCGALRFLCEDHQKLYLVSDKPTFCSLCSTGIPADLPPWTTMGRL